MNEYEDENEAEYLSIVEMRAHMAQTVEAMRKTLRKGTTLVWWNRIWIPIMWVIIAVNTVNGLFSLFFREGKALWGLILLALSALNVWLVQRTRKSARGLRADIKILRRERERLQELDSALANLEKLQAAETDPELSRISTSAMLDQLMTGDEIYRKEIEEMKMNHPDRFKRQDDDLPKHELFDGYLPANELLRPDRITFEVKRRFLVLFQAILILPYPDQIHEHEDGVVHVPTKQIPMLYGFTQQHAAKRSMQQVQRQMRSHAEQARSEELGG